jgi:hypothetical protein
MNQDRPEPDGSVDSEDRRRFLEKCGRFAIVTPPAMTMLLSVAAKPREAHASIILGRGWGNLRRSLFPPRRRP